MSVQNVNQIDIDWKTVIALFSMIISFVSMLISLHSATKEERKERQIKRLTLDTYLLHNSKWNYSRWKLRKILSQRVFAL